MAYDNLSHLTPDQSDDLCRVATGGGLGKRKLYSDDDEVTFYAKRPLILNGINEIATRGDLLSRSIVLTLPRLASPADERSLKAAFEAARPGILGALLDATATALRRWPTTTLDNPPRMADFARWVEAAAPALGWQQGEFLRAYAANRDEAATAELEASLLGARCWPSSRLRGGSPARPPSCSSPPRWRSRITATAARPGHTRRAASPGRCSGSRRPCG
jgi:hypothetical protein